MDKPLLLTTTYQTRTSIRKKIRRHRQSLTSSFQKHAADALLLTLINDNAIKSADHIAVYLANDGELDLLPFIRWCWQKNKQVYLPVVHPFSAGNLLFLRYNNDSILIKNRYKILEPKLDVRAIMPSQNLDIMLTPLVGFDQSGARLGMGGGYYDRTLANWYAYYQKTQHYCPFPIGIAHNCQQVDKLPVARWDVPLPKIITPTRVINCY